MYIIVKQKDKRFRALPRVYARLEHAIPTFNSLCHRTTEIGYTFHILEVNIPGGSKMTSPNLISK